LVKEAISTIPNKYRTDEEVVIKSALGWYGEIVNNINPCIFNLMVKVFEYLESKGVELSGDEYLDFAGSYEFETENGHSHYITGVINCHVGSVEEVLQKAFASVTQQGFKVGLVTACSVPLRFTFQQAIIIRCFKRRYYSPLMALTKVSGKRTCKRIKRYWFLNSHIKLWTFQP
jgi:hypothetical protein